MTCREAQHAIDDAVERNLALGATRLHLESCRSCAERHGQLLNLRTELSKRAPEELSDARLAAIRARVLERMAARSPWGRRLGWAVVAFAAVGSALAGWTLSLSTARPPLTATFEAPEAPAWALSPPLRREQRPAIVAAPREIAAAPHEDPEPEIRVAAIIPPDAETASPGGVLLELESKNPNVVLYFMADNQGD